MNKMIVAVAAVAASLTASAVEWKNLDDAHHLGGRKTSNGYMLGKVVLVDRWGAHCPPCRKLLPDVEKLWQSFKSKPFVVLGGHCAGWGSAEEVKALIERDSLTYSVYEDAGLATGEPQFNAIPFLYVVDETGRVIYQGRDEKAATQVIVTAITDMESPRSLVQYTRFLDFELQNLPGRAYLRMKDFQKRFPAEAKKYADKFKELSAIPDVKKLAELVEFARKAKDAPTFNAKQKVKKLEFQKKVKAAVTKYESLKESQDPRVVQEAKNSLADLKWTIASF